MNINIKNQNNMQTYTIQEIRRFLKIQSNLSNAIFFCDEEYIGKANKNVFSHKSFPFTYEKFVLVTDFKYEYSNVEFLENYGNIPKGDYDSIRIDYNESYISVSDKLGQHVIWLQEFINQPLIKI